MDQRSACHSVQTTADTAVPPQHSLVFYRALVEQGVPADLHIIFAVADWSPQRRYLGPFRGVFA